MNGSDVYIPVSLNTILINTNVGCDLYLKHYENKEIHYILYCEGTKVFSQEKVSGLKKNKIESLYIHERDQKIYLKYLEPCLKKIIDDDINKAEKARIVYDVAKNIMEDIFRDPRSGVPVGRVKDWVSNATAMIIRDQNASVLMNILSFDYYTYTHSVNVAVLGLLFMKYIDVELDEMNAVGIGLMLHDIGKTNVASDIINKKGALTDEEFEKVKMHVEFGGQRLSHADGIEEVSFLPVMQHHEKINGKGYPKGLEGNAIHRYGKIAAIIDVYDALTTKRPYCDARKPFTALKIMKDEMDGSFDKELFTEFILFLNQAR
ncbi:MAG: HD domain-containing protein [Candidatus Brocadia sp.]|jgi:HD-GYP domain|uniref:HD-GYP domain-containing protein n=1 Tax=Candidatus Brocadia fulgida TaxID=380242 RepID=A0A0M2UR07_9BACT|nr:MAG: hypothetical protein BROFUL_03024 [Candidatus Brocadia fulgida]UJS21886.1 MAG: HD domain-containing protein [Candidatus Brocadia sp.]